MATLSQKVEYMLEILYKIFKIKSPADELKSKKNWENSLSTDSNED